MEMDVSRVRNTKLSLLAIVLECCQLEYVETINVCRVEVKSGAVFQEDVDNLLATVVNQNGIVQ